jgi:hypothetical protein
MTVVAVIENESGAGQSNSFAARPRLAPQDGSSFRSGLVSLLAMPGNVQPSGHSSVALDANPEAAIEDAKENAGVHSQDSFFTRPQPAVQQSRSPQNRAESAAAAVVAEANLTGASSTLILNHAVNPQLPPILSLADRSLPATPSSSHPGNTFALSQGKKVAPSTGNAEQVPGIAAFQVAAAPVPLRAPQPASNAGPQTAPANMGYATFEPASYRAAPPALAISPATDVPPANFDAHPLAQPSVRGDLTGTQLQAASNVEEIRNGQSVQGDTEARGSESFAAHPNAAAQDDGKETPARPAGDVSGSTATSDSLSNQIQIVSPIALDLGNPEPGAPARIAEPADASHAIHSSGNGPLLNSAASAASPNSQPRQASSGFANASQTAAAGFASGFGSGEAQKTPSQAGPPQKPELRSRANDAALPGSQSSHTGQQPAASQGTSIPARNVALSFTPPPTQPQPSGSAWGNFGAPSRDTFAALDAGTGGAAPTWIHAGAERAEAGFEDPALGWVGVRAGLEGGGVHASLIPGSDEASVILGSQISGLNAFLAEHHTGVATLSLAPPESRSIDAGDGGFGQNADQSPQQGTGQSSQQGSYQGTHESPGQSPNELSAQPARHDVEPSLQTVDSSTLRSSEVIPSAIASLLPIAGRAGGTYISVMA